jgi:gliding motility-associated-like protein
VYVIDNNQVMAVTAIAVTGAAVPVFTLGTDTAFCGITAWALQPNSSITNAQYMWSNGATSPSVIVTTSGNYWLKITTQQGCVFKDTINVSFKTLPNFTLGANSSICAKDSIILNATVPAASNYVWSTNATTSSIYATQAGMYWCKVTKDGCAYADSIDITVKPLPTVQLGADTTLCNGITKTVNAFNTGATYTWQDNTMNPTYTINKAGIYSVLVTQNNCIAKDTIQITYVDKPLFTLGNSQFICPTQNIVLSPAVLPTWQLQWQDASTAKTFTVTQPGIYYANATNICGTSRQQIQITQGLCTIFVPAAFSPNGDGKNDIFKIAGTSLVSNFHVQIFNRFGQQVFETTDKYKGWNGQYNNQPAEQATYIYILQYKESVTGQQKLYKGSFVLLR